MSDTKIGFKLFVFLMIIKELPASGVIEVKPIEYYNIHGLAHDGTPCPREGCKNIFKICLKSGTLSKCLTTKEYAEDNTGKVYFGVQLNSAANNPWKITLARIKEYYTLNILVTVNGTLFDVFQKKITIGGKKPFQQKLQISAVSKYNKTMELDIRAECHISFTGPFCTKKNYVPRDDDNGRYTCGKNCNNLCLPGWKNSVADCVMNTATLSNKVMSSRYQPLKGSISSYFSYTFHYSSNILISESDADSNSRKFNNVYMAVIIPSLMIVILVIIIVLLWKNKKCKNVDCLLPKSSNKIIPSTR